MRGRDVSSQKLSLWKCRSMVVGIAQFEFTNGAFFILLKLVLLLQLLEQGHNNVTLLNNDMSIGLVVFAQWPSSLHGKTQKISMTILY